MIVIKKYHYVIAVLLLVAAVFLAMKSAAGREKNGAECGGKPVEVRFSSTAPEQEDSNAAETTAKAEEPLVGV